MTLALLPILVIHYGYSVLDKIHRGYFDEADIKIAGIPDVFKDHVNLNLLCNDFFGHLIFILKLHDNDCVFQLLEDFLDSLSNETEYEEMVLQYVAIRMLSQKNLPWEIEYSLKSIMQQHESLSDIEQRYIQEKDSYDEYVKWYLERLSCTEK